MSRWSISSEFNFCGRKTRFSYAIAANKRANSHNFKTKNLNLLTITFLADYLMNRGKSSYLNKSSIRVNNTFRKFIDCFWRKHCGDSPCQTSFVVFQKCTCAFFFSFPTRSLIDRCQIVTDTCLIMFQSFIWKPFKLPLLLRKWKCSL